MAAYIDIKYIEPYAKYIQPYVEYIQPYVKYIQLVMFAVEYIFALYSFT